MDYLGIVFVHAPQWKGEKRTREFENERDGKLRCLCPMSLYFLMYHLVRPCSPRLEGNLEDAGLLLASAKTEVPSDDNDGCRVRPTPTSFIFETHLHTRQLIPQYFKTFFWWGVGWLVVTVSGLSSSITIKLRPPLTWNRSEWRGKINNLWEFCAESMSY